MNKPADLKGLILDPVTNDQRYIGNSEPRHRARRLLEVKALMLTTSSCLEWVTSCIGALQ